MRYIARSIKTGDKISLEELIDKGIIHADKKGDSFEPIYWYNKDENQRLSVIISGSSGSGKSTLACKIVDDLAKQCQYQVFIFSINKDEDILCKPRKVAFDKEVPMFRNGKLLVDQDYNPICDIKRCHEMMEPIRVDYENPEIQALPLEYYRDSIVVFDDIEQLSGQTPKEAKANTLFVKNLQSLMLTAGRKLNIHIVNTLHNIRDGNPLAKLENQYWVFPVRGTPKFKLVGVLVDLLGYKKKDAENLIDQLGDTRHVIIHTHYPNYIVCDRFVQLI